MEKFESFRRQKRAKEYNKQLVEVVEGYADLTQIGTIEGEQIWKVVVNPDADRTICFVAGLHGDEPAGPLGILSFLESRVYVPKTKRLVIIPLANPTGWNLGTRENASKVDLNRHFLDEQLENECQFVWNALKDEGITFLHTLHEDPDLKEFYLYYTHDKELAEDLRKLASKYFPIYGKSNREPIPGELYKDKIHEGLIPLPHVVRGGIEDKALGLGIPYVTTESPGKANLSRRIKFNEAAMKLTIHAK